MAASSDQHKSRQRDLEVTQVSAAEHASISPGAITLRAIGNRGRPADEYSIDLLDGSYAILIQTPTGVWSVIEYRLQQPPINRGLFGTPEDALELFRAELIVRLLAGELTNGSKTLSPGLPTLESVDEQRDSTNRPRPLAPNGSSNNAG